MGIALDGGGPRMVLAEDEHEEHDEVVEEKLESIATRPLPPPASRVVLALDDPLPTRTPELAVFATLNVFSDVLSLPLLSLPLLFSFSFSFCLSRPPANPSGLRLPI